VCEQLVLQAGTHPGYQRGARTPANLSQGLALSTSTRRWPRREDRGAVILDWRGEAVLLGWRMTAKNGWACSCSPCVHSRC